MKLRAHRFSILNLAVILILAGPCRAWGAEADTTTSKPPAPLFEAFQLSPYLRDQSVEDIMDAIQVAWQTEPSHSPAAFRLKFHVGTKQLFVYASKDALEVIRSVITHLNPISAASSVLTANAADEQRRLDAIATEVRQRRALRESAALSTVAKVSDPAVVILPPFPMIPNTPPKSQIVDPAFKDEIDRRRAARSPVESKMEASVPAAKE